MLPSRLQASTQLSKDEACEALPECYRVLLLQHADDGPSSQDPFRVSTCAARTLNATVQCRVTLSRWWGALKSSPWATAGGKRA